MTCRASLLLPLVVLCVCAVGTAVGEFSNKEVVRKIDLTTHIARHSVMVTIDGDGDGDGKYLAAVPTDALSKLVWVGATDEDGQELGMKPTTVPGGRVGVQYYAVDMPDADASPIVELSFVYVYTMSPLPAEVGQGDPQLVTYNDNHFFFSPYKTASMRTEVKLASAVVESHSEEAPTAVRSDVVEYGPYEDVAPFRSSALRVHFEHNDAFFAVDSVERDIEVSHWGNVAEEEHYTGLRHTGAALKGFFSRYEMQRNPMGNGQWAVKSLKMGLHAEAADVYYRDAIGNISTSHLTETDDGRVLELIPRFPIFGGWQTTFYTGWNLPLQALLSRESSSGRYTLNATFAPRLRNLVARSLTVSVCLPEGATNIRVSTHAGVTRLADGNRKTYLDTVGRPVVRLQQRDVVEEHAVPFAVSYDFAATSVLREPAMMVASVFSVFAAYIALRTAGALVFAGKSE